MTDPAPIDDIPIGGEVIRLGQFLKFAGYADVEEPPCVLVMDEERIAAGGVRVIEENGCDGELYPHISGPIRPEFVVDVIPAHFDDRGAFTVSGPLG